MVAVVVVVEVKGREQVDETKDEGDEDEDEEQENEEEEANKDALSPGCALNDAASCPRISCSRFRRSVRSACLCGTNNNNSRLLTSITLERAQKGYPQ